MKVFTDQMGNSIRLEKPPKRIISLVPSQTELLYNLGLNEEVIGITKFCIHPKEWLGSKPKVGGTKKLNFEKIKELQPDLIIGNKEENEEVQIKELMKYYPVWMSDIQTLNDAYKMIQSIGEITDKDEEARNLVNTIRKGFENFKSQISNFESPIRRCLYFIWRDPYMVAGSTTFIDHMLGLCGFKNSLFEELVPGLSENKMEMNRYPEMTIEKIKQINPDFIFLSSEPYPFKEKHIAEFQSICPDAKVQLVDGEIFSWYGSRLLKAPIYLSELVKTLNNS